MIGLEFLFQSLASINHHALAQTWMKHKNGGSTYLWNEEFVIWRKISMNFRPFSPMHCAFPVCHASVNLHWKISPSAPCLPSVSR